MSIHSHPTGTGQSRGFVSLLAIVIYLLAATSLSASEVRQVPDAPAEFLTLSNPVNLDELQPMVQRRIKRLYKNKCKKCHGVEGDGKGPHAEMLEIPPVAFNAPGYLAQRKDGQLFWIIMHGSPGTDMEARGPGTRENLTEDEIWGLIAHIRRTFTQ